MYFYRSRDGSWDIIMYFYRSRDGTWDIIMYVYRSRDGTWLIIMYFYRSRYGSWLIIMYVSRSRYGSWLIIMYVYTISTYDPYTDRRDKVNRRGYNLLIFFALLVLTNDMSRYIRPTLILGTWSLFRSCSLFLVSDYTDTHLTSSAKKLSTWTRLGNICKHKFICTLSNAWHLHTLDT